MPIILGATPAAAEATIRAWGVNPWCLSASSDPSSNAQAPSFTPEAFPAVIVPFGFTMGFSFDSASSVVSGRACSSFEKSRESPFFCGTGTATISCFNLQLRMPSAARCWLLRANRS